jgi:hypothetical protein
MVIGDGVYRSQLEELKSLHANFLRAVPQHERGYQSIPRSSAKRKRWGRHDIEVIEAHHRLKKDALSGQRSIAEVWRKP